MYQFVKHTHILISGSIKFGSGLVEEMFSNILFAKTGFHRMLHDLEDVVGGFEVGTTF